MEDQVAARAREVYEAGRKLGLPYIAVSADIGSPEPMVDAEGRPFAETLFRWIDPDLEYWKDRAFALRSALVHATRTCAEPFYFAEGELGSWRPNEALQATNDPDQYLQAHVECAIVAPVHLPGGVIGAIVWASDKAFDVKPVFETHAEYLHALALKFIATYHDAHAIGPKGPAVYLTRREIQCLKWAAAGKTDSEIATIIDISVPTVRFHITNSARKLGVSGKARAIRRATTLGYIGID
ncbi:helix-turn-helix transcriptional regulator [Henriciella aquimarina]|uniref:helix-turn-helix transcriptional regulator n=1 Tax=Henriciella aquimarina TaxID=545261 RepID=UPI001F40902F|nr:helix-turn-helix transcriptional regulator [Henriciella aquimarina]